MPGRGRDSQLPVDGHLTLRCRTGGTVWAAVEWTKAVLVLLVVLLVLLGLPLLMPGMAHGTNCADCGLAIAGTACTLAVLAAFVFAVALLAQVIRSRRDRVLALLRAAVFDRPPQFA